MTKDAVIARLQQMMDENDGVNDDYQLGYYEGVRDALEVVRAAAEPSERLCACVPQMARPWKYCTDCGGRIPENREAGRD